VAGSWLGFSAMAARWNGNASCAVESGPVSVCGAIDSNNAFYAGTWNKHHLVGFQQSRRQYLRRNAFLRDAEHQPGGLRDQGSRQQVYERRRPVR